MFFSNSFLGTHFVLAYTVKPFSEISWAVSEQPIKFEPLKLKQFFIIHRDLVFAKNNIKKIKDYKLTVMVF